MARHTRTMITEQNYNQSNPLSHSNVHIGKHRNTTHSNIHIGKQRVSPLLKECIINGSKQDCLNVIKNTDIQYNKKTCALAYSKIYVKKLSYSRGEIGYQNYIEEDENILMLALLYQTPDIINAIIDRWPELVALTIVILQKLHQFVKNKYRVYSDRLSPYQLQYDPFDVIKSLQRLSKTQLPKSTSFYKSITSDTKKILLSSIQEDIDAANDWGSLYKLYQKYIDSPILSARRHSVWDSCVSIWKGNKGKLLYTQSIKNLILKLQERILKIIVQENASRELISEVLCSDLFSAEHFQGGVPEDHLQTIKSIDLNIQNIMESFKTVCLFTGPSFLC